MVRVRVRVRGRGRGRVRARVRVKGRVNPNLLGGGQLQVLEGLLELILRPLERGQLPRNVARRKGVDLSDGLGRELVRLLDG